MPQRPGTMRRDRSAAVIFGIDERPQLLRGFDNRVEVQPDLAQESQVGTEAGGRDDPIGVEKVLGVGRRVAEVAKIMKAGREIVGDARPEWEI